MEAAKQKYNSALVDLNSINGKYMEDMAEVFERTQQFERLRLEFNKIILAEFHNSLDLSQNPA
jgi:protein kinase C and casein kinase substrate in neurons protein